MEFRKWRGLKGGREGEKHTYQEIRWVSDGDFVSSGNLGFLGFLLLGSFHLLLLGNFLRFVLRLHLFNHCLGGHYHLLNYQYGISC